MRAAVAPCDLPRRAQGARGAGSGGCARDHDCARHDRTAGRPSCRMSRGGRCHGSGSLIERPTALDNVGSADQPAWKKS